MEIIKKDIRDINKFEKYGSTFSKIWGDDEHHLYVFKRTKNRTDYEVVRGVKKKNPDGSIVYTYPSSENFGINGYYIMGIPENLSKSRIVCRLKQFYSDVDVSNLQI